MPIRVQRKRTKGWRMPADTVYVGRGSIWGNPFVPNVRSGIFDGECGRPLGICEQVEILIPKLTLNQCIEFYRELIGGLVRPEMYPWGHQWMDAFHKTCAGHPSDNARGYLKGRNLACWCPLVDNHGNYMPCHADVLLSIANDLPIEGIVDENLRRAKGKAA